MQPLQLSRLWRFRILPLLLAALCFTVGRSVSLAQAAPPAELFLPATPGVPPTLHNDMARRSRPVVINFPILDALDSRQAHTIQITLFDKVRYTAKLESCVLRGPRSYTWFGTIPDIELSSLQLTANGDCLVMRLAIPGRGVYALRREGGITYLAERDPTRRGGCGIPLPVPLPDLPPPAASGGSLSIAAVNVIDIAVFYTTETKNEQGGVNAVVTLAQAAVDQTNQAFSASNCNAALRLTDVQELPNFAENDNNYSEMLDRFRQDSGVRIQRDLLGADLCCLLVSDRQDNGSLSYTTGIGYVLMKSQQESPDPSPPSGRPDYGYHVVHDDDADDLTFAHEVGHNLGCGHSLNEDSHIGCFTWSHGYRFTANGAILYYTVMGYGYFLATQVGRFSNPSDTYGGRPYGDAATADNARTIRITGSVVAGYRDAPLYVDRLASPFFQDGTRAHPYVTVSAAVLAASSTRKTNIYIRANNYNEHPHVNKPVRFYNWTNTGHVNIGKP